MFSGTLWDYDFLVEYNENDNWKNPRANEHFHRIYEIYYLYKNELNYFIGDKTFQVKEGTVIIVPPNTIHSTRSINHNSRKRFLLYIPESYVSEFLTEEPDLLKRLEIEPFVIPPAKRKHIEKIFLYLLNEFKSAEASTVMLKSLLGELLVTLYRISTENESNTIKYETIDKKSSQIISIANYINSNYNQNISLETLSKKFFLHPAYISRAFKKVLNINLVDYIKSVRIKEACVLLKNSESDISDIAINTGFESSSSFIRTFKSIVGITPLQYRKINIENNENTSSHQN